MVNTMLAACNITYDKPTSNLRMSENKLTKHASYNLPHTRQATVVQHVTQAHKQRHTYMQHATHIIECRHQCAKSKLNANAKCAE